jgi:acyl-CoA thioesterase-2
LPHEETLQKKAVMMASLDHALWFHRPLEVTQGVLSVLESPSTSNARGFARGNIFDAGGNLISSVAQEGLFRIH